jgi:hypothetical protein
MGIISLSPFADETTSPSSLIFRMTKYYPDTADFIHIRLTAAPPQSSPLFNAIPLRQNTRSQYDGQPIKVDELDQLQALSLEPGVVLHFVNNPAGLEAVLEYVNQGNLSQYADKTFIDKLIYCCASTKKKPWLHWMASIHALRAIRKCPVGLDSCLSKA